VTHLLDRKWTIGLASIREQLPRTFEVERSLIIGGVQLDRQR
jgi:hypothetical protein